MIQTSSAENDRFQGHSFSTRAFVVEALVLFVIYASRGMLRRWFDTHFNPDQVEIRFLSLVSGVLFAVSSFALRQLSERYQAGERSFSIIGLTVGHFLIAAPLGLFLAINLIVLFFK